MSGVVIRFDMSQVLAVGARMDLVQTEIEQEMRAVMADVMDAAELRARAGARVDTGENRSKTEGTAEAIRGGVLGKLGTRAPHGYVMELGRRPGRAMPPKGALLGWMRRRGIPETAEYPIRRAIGRRGITADRNLRNTMQRTQIVAERELRGIGPRVVRRAIRGATR